ncbi:MAG TPA: flavin reductase family protein [Ensifer sp.]|nr:flavin reductase family protein [Ensifer sp.]
MNAVFSTFTKDITAVKRAFSLFPSGVAVITTRDRDGKAQGFTASSFTPLSLDPLMVLVCIGRNARCFEAFMEASYIGISVLRGSQADIAMQFSSRATDKFANLETEDGPFGSPLLRGAVSTFEGMVAGRFPGGDHVVLTVSVDHMTLEDEGDVMAYFARGFSALAVPAQ